MNVLRTRSHTRIGLILIALFAWLAFSNRCALGQLFSANRAVAVQHSCCEQKELPKQDPASPDSQECCKGVHALAISSAKAPLQAVLMVAVNYLASIELPPIDACPSAYTADGPPKASSFSELVLHRSLHSHAPPLCA